MGGQHKRLNFLNSMSNLDEFVDWLKVNTIERVFEYCDISKEKKVKLVSIHFKGRGSTSWEHMQVSRQWRGKGKI